MKRAGGGGSGSQRGEDPDGELEELVGIYQGKGLDAELARQVAAALTERDPVAAHTDAELRLDELVHERRGSGAGGSRWPVRFMASAPPCR